MRNTTATANPTSTAHHKLHSPRRPVPPPASSPISVHNHGHSARTTTTAITAATTTRTTLTRGCTEHQVHNNIGKANLTGNLWQFAPPKAFLLSLGASVRPGRPAAEAWTQGLRELETLRSTWALGRIVGRVGTVIEPFEGP